VVLAWLDSPCEIRACSRSRTSQNSAGQHTTRAPNPTAATGHPVTARVRTATAITSGDGGRLVLADGAPVTIDLTNRTATRIDPETGHPTGDAACIDTSPADSTVTVAGSTSRPEIYTASGQDGALRITDLNTGGCARIIPISDQVRCPGSAAGSDLARRIEPCQHHASTTRRPVTVR
jgi:hypothetical protein